MNDRTLRLAIILQCLAAAKSQQPAHHQQAGTTSVVSTAALRAAIQRHNLNTTDRTIQRDIITLNNAFFWVDSVSGGWKLGYRMEARFRRVLDQFIENARAEMM